MQDLGRIVIDINESGSSKAEGISGIGNMNEDSAGGAAGAAEEIGSLAEVASTAAAAFTVVIGAFAAMAKVVGKVADALIALNRFVMEVANDLRDYSPGIQLAEMQNQIAMVNTKFRAGMQYGGAIGAQMLEVGRIERSFVEIKAAFAGIGSIFLKPITSSGRCRLHEGIHPESNRISCDLRGWTRQVVRQPFRRFKQAWTAIVAFLFYAVVVQGVLSDGTRLAINQAEHRSQD